MILERVAAHARHRPSARVVTPGREVSYAELLDLAASTAAQVPTGTHVALSCRDPLKYLAGFLAVRWCGSVVLPVAAEALHEERTWKYLQHCNVSSLISDLPGADHYGIPVTVPPTEAEKTIYLPQESNPDGPAMILQTSGTTSNPKAAVLSERALFWNAINSADRLGITAEDRGLISLPLTYSFGLNMLLGLLCNGADAILFRREIFLPSHFMRDVREHQATVTPLVASHMYSLLAQGGPCGDDWPLRALVYAGGSTPTAWVKELSERWPRTRFMQGYGLTEAGPRVAMHDIHDEGAPRTSAGRVLPEITLKVHDGKRLVDKPGVVGELWVKTPSHMLYYYDNDQATREIMVGDWLRTGDLGYLDEQGYLYIKGRLKNLIKVGGRSVCPEEIEEVLLELDGVAGCRVYGAPNEGLGEVVAADLVATGANPPDEAAIRTHCRKRLEAFKIPRVLQWVSDIPKTDRGKIRRNFDPVMLDQSGEEIKNPPVTVS